MPLGVCLSSGQLDPSQYHSWPLDVAGGVCLSSGQLDTSQYHLGPLVATGGMSELRSTGPKSVPLPATRCCWQVCLSSGQPDLSQYHSSQLEGECPRSGQLDPSQYHSWPLDATGGMSELRSTWPKSVPLLATRCCWGYVSAQVKWSPLLATRGGCLSSGQLNPSQYHSWPLDAAGGCLSSGQFDPSQYHSWPLDAAVGYIWVQVNWSPLLATRGDVWAQVNWTQVSTTLGH